MYGEFKDINEVVGIKKKSKFPKILLVLLLVAAGVGGWYYYNNKGSNNNDVVETKEEKKDNNGNNVVNPGGGTNPGGDTPVPEEKTITEDMNKNIDLFIKYFKSTYIDISNEEVPSNEKLLLAFKIVNSNYDQTVSVADIHKGIITYFGKDTKYKYADIMSIYDKDEVIAYYNATKAEFEYNSASAHGYSAPEALSYEVARKYVDDNTIEVRLKRVYYMAAIGPVTKIYKDPELKTAINVSSEYLEELECYDCEKPEYGIKYENYLKDNKDKLDTVVFKFIVEDGNPVFKRVYQE